MLSLVFDTQSGNNTVYVGPKATVPQTLLSVIILIISSLFCLISLGVVVILVGALGSWLGGIISEGLRSVVAIVLILPALYYCFLASVIGIAYAGSFVRLKILKNVGYFHNGYFSDKDNRILECYAMDGTLITKVDLQNYSTLISNNSDQGKGLQLCLKSTSGEFIDLSSIFGTSFNTFDPTSGRPGSRPNRNDNFQPYPTDELFALWNKLNLVRDGKEIPQTERLQIAMF